MDIIISIFSLLLLVVLIAKLAQYPLKFVFIKVLQKMGSEGPDDFVTTTTASGVKRKIHKRGYRFCISVREGRDYIFALNKVANSYFFYLPGQAYLGQLLPELWTDRKTGKLKKDLDLRFYYRITVPSTLEGAQKIARELREKKDPVILTESEIKKLIQPDFDITINMTWWQKVCWESARVYWFQDWFMNVSTFFQNITYAKVIQAPNGTDPVLEKHEEPSMNYIAKSFDYGYQIDNLNDVSGLKFGIKFILRGLFDNPAAATLKNADVFSQTNTLVRGIMLEEGSKFSYLSQSSSADAVLGIAESVIKVGELPEEVSEPSALQPKEATLTRLKRIAQVLNDSVLTELSQPGNYYGFVAEAIRILDIYPTGGDADKIITRENEVALAGLDFQKSLFETAERTAKELSENKIADDAERLRIEREALEIERKGKAQAASIEAVANAKTKEAQTEYAALKEVFGDNAPALVAELAKFRAIEKNPNTTLFLDSGSNNIDAVLKVKGIETLNQFNNQNKKTKGEEE